jgi:hypothetical protein
MVTKGLRPVNNGPATGLPGPHHVKVGLAGFIYYNHAMTIGRGKGSLVGVAAIALEFLAAGCGERGSLPKDANLDTFIKVSAQCVFVDRAFSREPELAREELGQVQFPANWKQLVDSLIAAHGSDPAFWHDVYTKIVERSRK